MGFAFILLFILSAMFAGSAFLFGHDGGDHNLSHPGDHGDIPSIFSPRIISLFLLGFSGMGIIAHYAWGLSAGASCLSGIGSGVVLGGVAYAFICALYKQQANSSVGPADYIGQTARVSSRIPAGGTGEISVTAGGQLRTLLATAANGAEIPEGRTVVITAMAAGTATVKLSD